MEQPLEAWFGEWEGEMVNLRGGSVASEPIPVEVRIRPLADGTIEWRTVYDRDLVRGLRDYRMVPDPDDPSSFTLDEQNGILLSVRLMEDVLIAPFEVGGQYLLSRYSLESDGSLRHEVILWSEDSASVTTGRGPAGEQGMPVSSFRGSSIQRTVLRRVEG